MGKSAQLSVQHCVVPAHWCPKDSVGMDPGTPKKGLSKCQAPPLKDRLKDVEFQINLYSAIFGNAHNVNKITFAAISHAPIHAPNV